jgi:hypothetical protein
MTAKAIDRDLPQGMSELSSNDAHDPNSNEYKLSTSVSFAVNDLVSACIGDVLDYLDAALQANPQTETLKKLVKQRMYSLTREVQHQVYYAFGQEPRQLGDTNYIESVRNGTDVALGESI